MRARRRLVWIGAVGLAVGLAAHIYFWYVPRLHPDSPTADTAAEELLHTEDHEWALWLAYPHQNLSVLDDELGGLRGALVEVAALAGEEPISLDGLGAWGIPPADALAIAQGSQGEFAAVVEVYPLVRWVARGAGLVAGNPWLRGGSVRIGGRRAHVEWHDGAWALRPEGAAVGASTEQTHPQQWGVADGEMLAALRIPDFGPLPAGIYSLRREGHGFALGSGSVPWPGLEELESAFVRSELAALVLVVTAESRTALLLGESGSQSGSLPSAARMVRGGPAALPMPLAESAARLGLRPLEAPAGDWRIQAWDRSALRSARALTTAFEELPPAPRDIWAAWADVAKLGRATKQVSALLKLLPLAPPQVAERWAAAAALAERIAPARVKFVAAGDDARVHIYRITPPTRR